MNSYSHSSSFSGPLLAIAARREIEAAEHPLRYRCRVAILTLLAWICLPACWLGLTAVLLWIGHQVAEHSLWVNGLALLTAAALGRQMFWVSHPQPQGVRLDRHQAPDLFRFLDKIRKRLAMTSPIDRVWLTDQYQLALRQHAPLGLSGPFQYGLVIGLPLLQGLSPKQFAALASQELAMIAPCQSAFRRAVFRQRLFWQQLLDSLSLSHRWSQQWLAGLVGRFAALLLVNTQPLARQMAFDADQATVRLAGQEACAEGMILAFLQQHFLDEDYWPKLLNMADRLATPDITPHAHLQTVLTAGLTEAPCARWLHDAINQPAGECTYPPALRERLEHIGAFPTQPRPPTQSAAQALLPTLLATLQSQLDKAWCKRIAAQWQTRHQQLRQARERLTTLRQQAESGSIELDDAYRRAHLTEELESAEAARSLYLEILAQHPEHPASNFAAGRLLLQENDERGLGMLEAAMRHDPKAIIPACRLAYDFLQRNGRHAQAENYYQAACERAALEDRALAERLSVSVSDTLLPHDLRPAQITRLQAQLAEHPSIRRAWLACKAVQYFSDRSLYVLLIERRAWPLHSHADDLQFSRELVDLLEMPGQSFVQVLHSGTRALHRNARQLPNASIYPAE